MSILDQLRLMVHPRGPLSYEQVRFYLTESGYTKPGKGMKYLLETIQASPDSTVIVKDLKETIDLMRNTDVARKKPGPKAAVKRSRNDLEECSEVPTCDDGLNTRLDEALALRGKTQSGSFERKVKRLLDALDEEDADDEPDVVYEEDLFGPE